MELAPQRNRLLFRSDPMIQDGLATPQVDVSRREIVQTLLVTPPEPIKVRCQRCGDTGELRVRPPMPQRESAGRGVAISVRPGG